MAWTDKLIRFPQERRTAAVDDYRAEPAVILILPAVRVDRGAWNGPLPASILPPDHRRERCIEAFDALNEAFRLLPIG